MECSWIALQGNIGGRVVAGTRRPGYEDVTWLTPVGSARCGTEFQIIDVPQAERRPAMHTPGTIVVMATLVLAVHGVVLVTDKDRMVSDVDVVDSEEEEQGVMRQPRFYI